MEAADRGMGIPGRGSAVLAKDLCQAFGILGEVVKGDRAILDKGNGFALLLHRHHDVEAGHPDPPYGALEGGIEIGRASCRERV